MNQKEQEQRGVELISDRVDPLLFEYDAGSFKAYDEDLDLVLRSRGHRGLNISHAKGVTVPMSRVMSHFRQSSENKDRTLDADSKKESTPVTGDQAIEFFGRQQDSMDVRVLFLVRTAASLHFRPYDLLVVDRKELEPEHFTMSTSGVVHVRPGFPSQFIPIGQWWRSSSNFNTLHSIPFFKTYYSAKMYQLWHQNVRFRTYAQIRRRLIRTLFVAKRAFCSTLLELSRQCYELRSTPLLSYHTKHAYAVEDFIEIQKRVRASSSKTFETIIDKIQALLEKVCEDVASRVRASENGLPPGGLEKAIAATSLQKSQKSKSMQQMKREAYQRARALTLARQEVAMLAQLIRLADYMVVESMLLLVMTESDSLYQDLQKPNRKSGLFNVTLSMERDCILYCPSVADLTAHMSSILEAMVSCVHSVPRILYIAPFKPHFQDNPKVVGAHLGDMIRSSSHFLMICSKIGAVIHKDFQATVEYGKFAEQYFAIFRYAEEFDKQAFAEQDHIINSRLIKREMLKLRGWGADLERMKLSSVVGIFGVDSKTLRNFLIDRKNVVLENMKSVLHTAAKESCENVFSSFHSCIKLLGRKPTNLTDFAAYVESKVEISESAKDLMQSSSTVDEMYKLLSSFDVKIPSSEQVKIEDLHMIQGQFTEASDAAQLDVSTKMGQMTQSLNSEISKIDQELMVIMADLVSNDSTNPNAVCTHVLEMLSDIKTQIDRISGRASSYARYQRLFNMTPHEYTNLTSIKDIFDTKFEIWDQIRQWEDLTSCWSTQLWMTLRPVEMERETQAQFKKAAKMCKTLDDAVAQRFKENTIKWKTYMPTLIALGNSALKPRHWEQIFSKLGRPYDNEMKLCDLLHWDIFQIKDFCEEISGIASGEYSLELQLEKIEAVWNDLTFTLSAYRDCKDIFILAGVDEIIMLLEDHQATLQTMLASRFVFGVRNRVEGWEKKLAHLSESLDEWLTLQRSWMYLEPIFGAPDIQKQLPQETVDFLRVDQNWKDIMRKTRKRPNAIEAACTSGLLDTFLEANRCLERIQKSLEDYLETKRMGFPRFYFLSNDELLEILSQSRDPCAIQPHLRKCFDAMASVEFDEGSPSAEGAEATTMIVAMKSPENERVPFASKVPTAPKSVEFWMCDLEDMMRRSLLDVTVEARVAYSGDNRSDWFFQFAAAAITTIDQEMWTNRAEDAIDSIQVGRNEDGLNDFLAFSIEQINHMVVVIRKDLDNVQRSVMANLIVLDVHARDVVKRMIHDGVSAITDFAWICQLRYYWDEKSIDDHHGVIVRQTNAQFYYAWEYLGVVPRLVITPLTDKCFMTLTGALNLLLGGAPAGPAGTGKTESVKDLGKALAMPVVVFNCSDGLDYKMMEKFFSGLAQAGAWACFDEFNRIDIEVLSVIAQQIMLIQNALKANVERFDFFGKEIRLHRNYGAFITMNPGYAGRTELPDNLKALFRPMAMMVPDYTLIAEIMLFSEGFGDSLMLARKQTALYRLASEQLSSQDHYDFGMRAVKSVLVMAGKLKRAEPSMVEDVTLIRALRDSNIPKFLAPDIPLFNAILRDLFPATNIPATDYGTVQQNIERILTENQLQVLSSFASKIIQLYETMLVRHGVMLVGVAAVGKTTVSMTLGEAFTRMKQDDVRGGFEKVDRYTLNPKSITMGELYGEFNLMTNEWTDGIISTIVREACNAVAKGDVSKKWISCDGPVDAIWIESMNTVLDDNKTLCLNNGERIKLPPTVTMMFEVNDLAVASPATVSRCGMVYLESVYLGWRPIAQSWAEHVMEQRFEGCGLAIMELLDRVSDKTLVFLRKECREHIVSLDTQLMVSFTKLLDSLLRDTYGVVRGNWQDMLPKFFAFSYFWTLGGNLQDTFNLVFDVFARSTIRDFIPDFPAQKTVHDWTVDWVGGNFIEWNQLVPEFTFDQSAPFFNLVVPTVDSTRIKFLLRAQIDGGNHVLLGGNSGVGKTLMVQDFLDHAGEGFMSQTKTFSAQTSARGLQSFFEEKLEKIRKNLLGPPSGKLFLFFIDDLNMPLKETYGAQPPIELLRQIINTKDDRNGGFYDLKKIGLFKRVQGAQFIAANAPPGGGRSEVTARLLRHFHLINVPDISNSTMKSIFLHILSGFLQIFPPEFAALAEPIIDGCIEVYASIQRALLPTPAKSHYTFNLRDLAKVVQGLLMVDPKNISDTLQFLRLWTHESARVFRDRLNDEQDQAWYDGKILAVLSKNLEVSWTVREIQDICFGDFLAPVKPAPYVEVPELQKAEATLHEFAEDYSLNLNKRMDLVFFKDAIEHISRIARLLRQPRGNALLVGVGGSGRHSLTKLAAYIAEMKCFQIELTRGYGLNEFHDDLKSLLLQAGAENKQTVFLFSDTQIINESFLEDINNLLNAGEVPDLFPVDEMNRIVDLVRPIAKAAGKVQTKDSIMHHFIRLCRENLHIVLAFSPVGDIFRDRLRMFPSLVNCCTIDWFFPWPPDALLSVAIKQLGKTEFGSDDLCRSVSSLCTTIHSSVREASQRFLVEVRRPNYTTPTSYLELLNLYTSMLGEERQKIDRKIARYQNGMNKLKSTDIMVRELKEEIIKLQPVLNKAAGDTVELIEVVTKDKESAAIVQAKVEEEAEKVTKITQEASEIRADAQKDLDEALPAFDSAVKALKSLNKNDITEIKSFAKPPEMVQTVMEGVCVLKGVKATWEESKKLLNDSNFLQDLETFDKDNIKEKTIKGLQKYINNPDFIPEKVEKVSKAAKSLCMWVRAMDVYARVAKNVEPKKQKLAGAENTVSRMAALLAEKTAELNQVLMRVTELEEKLRVTLDERDSLQNQSDVSTARLERAEQLTGGLSSEQVRWESELAQLSQDKIDLTGNILVAAGIIAYTGAFTFSFRAALIQIWLRECEKNAIHVDINFSLERVVGDAPTIRTWNIQGLPADPLSCENGIIVTKSRRWPLMIDPQTQANRWVRSKEKSNRMQVIKLTESNYLRTLENCIRVGNPVLLENVGESLDPAIEPVLSKTVFKQAGRSLIRLGDTDVDYSPDFRFYITSKLPNPHYSPEICVKVTIVNFTVTPKGLEDQLLVQVVAHERPELEEEKNLLMIQIAEGQKQLQDIEDKILYMLANSVGNILDDEILISTLAASKATSIDINGQLKLAQQTKERIVAACEVYRPVSKRGAVLYFVVADFGALDPMYQYSLQFFLSLFRSCMDRAARSEVVVEHVRVMIKVVTEDVYTSICRGLFEKDKKIFSFMIAIQIMRLEEFTVSDVEWAFLLTKGGFPDEATYPSHPANEWLMHDKLGGLANLEKLEGFDGLMNSLSTEGESWKRWFESLAPQDEILPGDWESSLTIFRKVLLIRVMRDEKFVDSVTKFITHQIGQYFVDVPPFDLSVSFSDSSPWVPIIFILSTGADPTTYLYNLAKDVGFFERLKMISLGQGQGPIAEALIASARESGDWVCLQNCHLASSWMPALESMLESHSNMKLSEEFRLWLSSMPSKVFPVSILQAGIKLTNEPPKGLRANMKRTYEDLTEAEFSHFEQVAINSDEQVMEKKVKAWKKLLFGLCFFHAGIQERRKYGAIGWNVRYEWNRSDLLTAQANLRMYLVEQHLVPYETLKYVVGEVNYGGRVTVLDLLLY